MQNTLPNLSAPAVAPTLPPFLDRVRSHHEDSLAAGPTGPLVLLFAFVSSASVLCWRGLVFGFHRCRALV